MATPADEGFTMPAEWAPHDPLPLAFLGIDNNQTVRTQL